MSSSYRCTRACCFCAFLRFFLPRTGLFTLWLTFWVLCVYFLLFVLSLVLFSVPVQLIVWTLLWNELLRVERDVKLHSLTHSLILHNSEQQCFDVTPYSFYRMNIHKTKYTDVNAGFLLVVHGERRGFGQEHTEHGDTQQAAHYDNDRRHCRTSLTGRCDLVGHNGQTPTQMSPSVRQLRLQNETQ